MFDVGFSELVLCFIVALVVLGPQKLPAVARTLGRWTGRARSYMRNFTAELEREASTASIKRELTDVARTVREGTQAIGDELRSLDPTRAPPKPASATTPAAPTPLATTPANSAAAPGGPERKTP